MQPRLSDIDLLELLAINEARESFYVYYRYMNPKYEVGWWIKEVCEILQEFYNEYMVGNRPGYILEAPPQHGKSKLIINFIAWMSGKNPDLRVIYTSFSERLGVRANLNLQRIYDTTKYKKIFPDLSINSVGMGQVASQGTTRNRELIEYIGNEGSFRNTTVRGSITGESLDIGIIDDPIKGREEANSKSIRDKTWDWFTDDFFTRFSDNAGFLTILTRWHIDDPVGRLKENFKGGLKIFSYKAIATDDERMRKKGEPLFPELKSLGFLEKRKEIMASASWESLYQQNPRVVEGELIKKSWFITKRYKNKPESPIRVIQSWDTAQKAAQLNDPSVCTTWFEVPQGYFLIDVLVLKAEYPLLKQEVINRYNMFRPSAILIEDKSSGSSLIQDIRYNVDTANIPIIPIIPCVDKETRASIASDPMEAGLIWLPEEASWLYDYEEELFTFPRAKHDDQVDSTTQFITWITKKKDILIG